MFKQLYPSTFKPRDSWSGKRVELAAKCDVLSLDDGHVLQTHNDLWSHCTQATSLHCEL